MTGQVREIITTRLWTADERDGFHLALEDFIEDMQELMASVPEAHRDSATIYFSFERGSYGDYGDPPSVELYAYWTREETDEELAVKAEMAKREAEKSEAAKAARAVAKRQHEIATLAALMEKYGIEAVNKSP